MGFLGGFEHADVAFFAPNLDASAVRTTPELHNSLEARPASRLRVLDVAAGAGYPQIAAPVVEPKPMIPVVSYEAIGHL